MQHWTMKGLVNFHSVLYWYLMSDPLQTGLIGVDGGGSRCRFAVCDGSGRVLARHEAGAANIASDFDAAFAVISAGLAQVMAAAGVAHWPRRHIHLGLAGANAPGAADRLRAGLAALLPGVDLVVEDDRRTAVMAALGGGDGAVASCGTGSFVCTQMGEDLRGLGGWGLALGDDASGGWLGQAAMRRAVLGLDGLVPMTEMLRSITAETGGDRPGMVAFSLRAKPPDYAALAPMIIHHAEAGDTEARRLMALGADYLRQALQVLGQGPGAKVRLLGGVGRHYAPYLADFACLPPKLPAVSGAMMLAARAAGIAVGDKPWT